MTMRKKIILWGLGSFFALLAAFLLLVPALLDSSFLKQKIQAAVSRKNIGQLDYADACLSIIPLPHLTIRQISLSVPERAVARIKILRVYPELIPLLKGQLQLSKIYLDVPDLNLILPEKSAKEKDLEKKSKPLNISDFLSGIIAPLAAYTSNLEMTIEQGRIGLVAGGRQSLVIRDLDLNADLKLMGPRSFKAKLNVATPALTLYRAGKKVTIDCDKLKATLLMDGDKVIFSLADLALARPALKLSGQLLADPKASGFNLDLTGRDLDVNAIRTAALELGEDNETIRDIFSYVKGGRIPNISIKSKGKRLADLGELKNIVIRGRMQDGDISIDDIGMHLTDVDGETLISRGLLEVSGASARLGETTGHDGSLKIGLTGNNDIFHLDIVLDAQLQQVPSVLKKIIKHNTFIQELSLIKNLKGTGEARLILGESMGKINTKIKVSRLQLSADYQRIPFPIKINQGQISFAENTVRIKDLTGKVGDSRFSNISCDIQWQKGLFVDIPSGSLTLDLGEFYPWISSFAALKKDMAGLKGAKGYLKLSSLKLKIPHDKSDQWQLTALGDVRDVAVNTTLLPQSFFLSSGQIQLKPNQFSFQKLKARMLDADLDLSGTISGPFRRPDSVNVLINGKLGAKATSFLRKRLCLPTAYALRAPLRFSDTMITWQPGTDFSFKGDVIFPKGARIFADFRYRPGDLAINHLDIQDQESKAVFVFDLNKNMVNLKFKGLLHETTLERIFVEKKLSDGWLKGDLQASFVRGRPLQSIMRGQLDGRNILLPMTRGKPLIIGKLAVTAHNKWLRVNQLSLVQQENRVDLKGRVDLTADGFLVNLDASAGALKWRASEKKQAKASNVPQDKSKKSPWHYPVAGTIHLAAKSFTWGNYTWEPFHADISRIEDGVNVEVRKSRLCGIDTIGTLQLTGNELALDFQLTAKDQDIASRYACLTKDRIRMTGSFDLSAQIKARSKPEDLLRSAHGHYEFTARNGQITQDKRLSRILEVINFTEIVRGKIPDLKTEGFNYETITVQGEFANDIMVFKKIYMDGKTLDLIGKGKLDLKHKFINVELLAAPFKTVDSVIKNIPGVNYLMAGNLISIPVRVKGDVSDPKVRIMSASDVRSNLLDFAKRVIKSPIKLIETMNYHKKRGQK